MTFDWFETANNLWFIPIIIFTAIILIGFTAGLFNGWAVATYFFVGEIFFFALGIGLYALIYPWLENLVEKFLPGSVKDYISDTRPFLDALKSPFGFIYMCATLLIGIVILFPFYFVFRKFLKKTHRKEIGFNVLKTKKSSRAFGALIGTSCSLLFAAPITATASVFTIKENSAKNNFLFQMNSKMVEFISFGLYDDPMSIQRALNAVAIASDNNFSKLGAEIANTSASAEELTNEFRTFLTDSNFDKIQSIFDDTNLFNGVKNTLVDILSQNLKSFSTDKNHEISVNVLKQQLEDTNSRFWKVATAYQAVVGAGKRFKISVETENSIIDSVVDDYAFIPDGDADNSQFKIYLKEMIANFAETDVA